MNSIEHRFPLPDLESHKLDEIKQNLSEPTVQCPAFDHVSGCYAGYGLNADWSGWIAYLGVDTRS